MAYVDKALTAQSILALESTQKTMERLAELEREVERLRKALSVIARRAITVDGGIDYESAYDAIITSARAALAQ